jgi:hypothetical protein
MSSRHCYPNTNRDPTTNLRLALVRIVEGIDDFE